MNLTFDKDYTKPFRAIAFRHRQLEFDVVGPSTGSDEDSFQKLLQKILRTLIKSKNEALEEMEELSSSSSSPSPHASTTAGSSPDMSESDADYSQSSDDEDCGFDKVDTLFGEAIMSIASADGTDVVSAVASREVSRRGSPIGEDAEADDDEVSLSSLSCEFNADADTDTDTDADADDDCDGGNGDDGHAMTTDCIPSGKITYHLCIRCI